RGLAPLPQMYVVRRYARDAGQRGQRLAAPTLYRRRIDGLWRGVFLHVEPDARAVRPTIGLSVTIDGERILGHVGVVDTVTAHLFAFGPRLELLEILGDAIAEHLRARGLGQGLVDARRAPGVQQGLLGVGRHVQSQQPAFERAIPHRVHTLGANTELEAGVRRARQDGGVPAGEVRAQHGAQFLHERACRVLVLEAYSVRRIGGEKSGLHRTRPGLGEPAGRELHEFTDRGARRIFTRRREHSRVGVHAAQHEGGPAFARLRLAFHRIPGDLVVA